MPSHLVTFWFTIKLIHIRLLLIIEIIMFTDLVVSKCKKKNKTYGAQFTFSSSCISDGSVSIMFPAGGT